VQFLFAQSWFLENITRLLTISPEYSTMVEATLAEVSVPSISLFSQLFSRPVTLIFIGMCALGFFFMVVKRKTRAVDKCIFLTGAFYSALGFLFYTLGSRAWALVFIPVSLGIAYLFATKYRKYFIFIALILLILFLFIPVRQSFENSDQKQTKEAYVVENFFISHIYIEKTGVVLSNYRVITYLEAATTIDPYFLSFDKDAINDADRILYTIGLGKDLIGENYMTDYDADSLFQNQELDVLYTNGFSHIAQRPGLK